MLSVGVLASGRGTNLQAILDASSRGDCDARVAVVISDRQGVQALDRARAAGVPAMWIPPSAHGSRDRYERAIVDALDVHGVELVALAGYMRLVGPVLLGRFPGRIINIHPALLPAFPGLDAQRQAYEHGVKITGCTVHFVDEGMDTGPIILQEAVSVREDDTAESLSARILEAEHIIYPRALDLLARGKVTVVGRRVMVGEARS